MNSADASGLIPPAPRRRSPSGCPSPTVSSSAASIFAPALAAPVQLIAAQAQQHRLDLGHARPRLARRPVRAGSRRSALRIPGREDRGAGTVDRLDGALARHRRSGAGTRAGQDRALFPRSTSARKSERNDSTTWYCCDCRFSRRAASRSSASVGGNRSPTRSAMLSSTAFTCSGEPPRENTSSNWSNTSTGVSGKLSGAPDWPVAALQVGPQTLAVCRARRVVSAGIDLLAQPRGRLLQRRLSAVFAVVEPQVHRQEALQPQLREHARPAASSSCPAPTCRTAPRAATA